MVRVAKVDFSLPTSSYTVMALPWSQPPWPIELEQVAE